MLTSLLPGMRNLRAPLAAGSLWLVALWLLVGRDLPKPGATSGLLADLYDAAIWAGKPAVFAALAFIAYLLGAISTAGVALAIALLAPLLVPAVAFDPPDASGGSRAARYVWPWSPAYWATRHGAHRDDGSHVLLPPRPKRIPTAKGLDALTRTLIHLGLDPRLTLLPLIDDLPLVPARLIGTDQELFAEFDRIRAEAEFRVSIGPPMTVLSSALLPHSAWWGLLMSVPVLLFVHGMWLYWDSNDLLAEALRAGRVNSPVVGNSATPGGQSGSAATDPGTPPAA
ncbi:hypothetical protein ABZ490_44420 [Streptomyces sp. NPDC005811]|uniref:hypothetical protein n=1 Tax=Streptomyces sp. NPDC005811 TaxID=3154565 RepID=UPI0033C69A5F